MAGNSSRSGTWVDTQSALAATHILIRSPLDFEMNESLNSYDHFLVRKLGDYTEK
jgi:hypothetical protein